MNNNSNNSQPYNNNENNDRSECFIHLAFIIRFIFVFFFFCCCSNFGITLNCLCFITEKLRSAYIIYLLLCENYIKKINKFFFGSFLDDFGLSISGYPNQSNSNLVSSKPPIYSSNTPVNNNNTNSDYSSYQPVAPLNPYEEFNERKIKTNSNFSYNQQQPGEYPMYPDEYSSVTTLPSIDKPKFEPTKATQ